MHYKNYLGMFLKITGFKMNFCFKNASVNHGNALVFEFLDYKETLFGIVFKSEQIITYTLKQY